MSTDLTTQDAAVAAIMAQQEAQEMEARFQTPILKLCQPLTKEVKEGDAEPGEFLNTLTGESYGTTVEFIVAFAQPGRSLSLKDGRYQNAIAQDTIPDNDFWKDAVGEEFVGTPFDEHPDAEEQYRERVNRGDIEWGSGPPISTTYNYTGLVIPPALEEDDEDAVDLLPVRISFARSTRSAHDKMQALKNSILRNKPFWEVVFELSSAEKSFGRHTSHIVNVRKTRKTNADEKALAVDLATAVLAGQVSANEQAEAEQRVAPDANGGAEI